MGRSPEIAVVVPTLDEERRLPDCLDAIGDGDDVEVVVSDGGSSDGTVAIAEGRPGVRVVRGPAGRGGQLNRGAAAASAARLVFVHADCVLPQGWRKAVIDGLADPRVALASFRLETVPEGGAAPGWRRRWLRMVDLRSRIPALPYGDQGFVIRTELFETLGGFAGIPLMEDLELARRCRRAGRIRRLPLAIRTTGRRFERRPVRTRIMTATFPLLFRLGVSPDRLARWYGHIR